MWLVAYLLSQVLISVGCFAALDFKFTQRDTGKAVLSLIVMILGIALFTYVWYMKLRGSA